MAAWPGNYHPLCGKSKAILQILLHIPVLRPLFLQISGQKWHLLAHSTLCWTPGQRNLQESTVEQHLHELLTTMYFSTPIPAIKVRKASENEKKNKKNPIVAKHDCKCLQHASLGQAAYALGKQHITISSLKANDRCGSLSVMYSVCLHVCSVLLSGVQCAHLVMFLYKYEAALSVVMGDQWVLSQAQTQCSSVRS